MTLKIAYQILCTGALAALVIMAVLCLVRCVRGPRISDRIMASNMIGTLTIIMVAVCTVLLHEGYLADIAIIYALLSFLAVVVLCKVYTGIYRERTQSEAEIGVSYWDGEPAPADMREHEKEELA